MAPVSEKISKLSANVIETFLHFYFSYPEASIMFAEPDINNHKACRLLERSKFAFIENVMLSHKAASLYSITRKQFYAAYSNR